MLRKTVVAFFIATIYINTAYAQEIIKYDKDRWIPGWNGLEELVRDAYKHYESTSPTYAQPTSGRVGFIDGGIGGGGKHGIKVQAVYCWYLSSFDDGCVYPTTFTTTTIEDLPYDYEFAGLPVKYVYAPKTPFGREFRNEFISDDIVTISAEGGTISGEGCGLPDAICKFILPIDITPSTGAHLVYSGENRRTANSTSQSLAIPKFKAIAEIARTTSKILTVSGFDPDDGDLTKQVCTGAEAWCIQSRFAVGLDYFGAIGEGNSFGTPLVGVVMWGMRQVSPTMTATDVFERVRKCTWVPDGVTTPDSIWGVGQLRATHDCLFPVKERVMAETTQIDTTEMTVVTRVVTTSTVAVVDDGVLTTNVITLIEISTDTSVAEDTMVTTEIGFFQDIIPRGTTNRFSLTESVVQIPSTRREMVVIGSPSTTQAFVGYTGSLITTETVTQTFTDKLVRGTRTTVDDVMTSSIRTSTLPVVTTMTTRDGELSIEKALLEQSTTLTLTKETQVTTIRLVGNGSILVISTTKETIRDMSVATTVAYTTEKTIVRYDGVSYATSMVRATTLRGTTTTAQDIFVTEDTETIPSTQQGEKTIVTTVVTIFGDRNEGNVRHIFNCPGTPSEIFKCPVLPEPKTQQTGSLTPSVVKLRLRVFLGGAVR